jgi:hypothetical protein
MSTREDSYRVSNEWAKKLKDMLCDMVDRNTSDIEALRSKDIEAGRRTSVSIAIGFTPERIPKICTSMRYRMVFSDSARGEVSDPDQPELDGAQVETAELRRAKRVGPHDFFGYGQTYWYGTDTDGIRQIGVVKNLPLADGLSRYIVAWLDDDIELRQVHGLRLVPCTDSGEMQRRLDAWARKRKLDRVHEHHLHLRRKDA